METKRNWTTKEKLAIASYVLRVGETDWAGLRQILGNQSSAQASPTAFSVHGTASQYRDLLNDFGLGNPLEERKVVALVDDLTQIRIQELKEHLEQQRNEYQKLEDEICLLQSGACDNSLDDLLKRCEEVDDAINNNADNKTDLDRNVEVSCDEVVLGLEESEQEADADLAANVAEQQATARNAEHEMVMEDSHLSDGMDQVEAKPGKLTGFIGPLLPNSLTGIDTVGIEENAENEDATSSSTAEVSPAEPHDPKKVEDFQHIGCISDPIEDTLEAGSRGTDVRLSTDEASLIREETSSEENPGVENGQDEDEEKTSHPDTLSCDDMIEENESVCNENIDIQDDSNPDTNSQTSPERNVSGKCENRKNSSKSRGDSTENSITKAWKKSTIILWKQIASHRNAPLFMQPVTDDIAPNYSSTITRAMDLSTLKRNVENGVITTTSEFQRDLMLMFQNALMYNHKDHTVYKMAEEMQSDVMDQVAQFLATQIMVNTTPQSVASRSNQRSISEDRVYATSDMLLSVLVSEARSKRVAAIEGEARFTRKKMPSQEA